MRLPKTLSFAAVLATSTLAQADDHGHDANWAKYQTIAERYVEAFNQKNSSALTALYADQGEILLQENVKLAGHDAIEQHYMMIFDSEPNAVVNLTRASIRFITPQLVLEEGSIRFNSHEENNSAYLYQLISQQQADGEWKIVQSRNHDVSAKPAFEALQQIEGLVGDWVAPLSEHGKLTINFRWDPSGSWLMGRGQYSMGDDDPTLLTMRIGWDPIKERIISWSFDSNGSHSQASWKHIDHHWEISSTGINALGKPISSTQRVEAIDQSSILWGFTERLIGKSMKDDEAVKLIKTEPKPF
ncbi:YybH family protein [Rubritalea marina]|uniref:YybH family protein n=1 Tax=Rubritalea marina TaxID=361055 RepID=UPI00037818CA|nr:SgcJ/EcaC family oxidoreductase [Rubritalea marina]